MPKLSKFFCVAVAGATVDGRTIEDNWISEMAASYNPATYTANVNIEHLRGISPEPPFNCQGKVVAVEERTIDLAIGGKTEKRKALFAQVEANDNLVTYNSRGQKLYPSVEVNPAFAGTGKAYLVGLATTDSPASLGTEMLTFAAGLGDNNPFNSRKLDKGNFFSATMTELGFNLEFEEPKSDVDGGFAAFMASMKSALAAFTPGGSTAPAAPAGDAGKDAAAPGREVAALAAAFSTGLEGLGLQIKAFTDKATADIGAIRGEVGTLKASIEGTDGDEGSKRPLATGAGNGGNGSVNYAATDC